MSVLIKGMDIPKQCSECRFCEGDTMDGLCRAANKWFDDDYFAWLVYEEDDIDDSKPLNCPLVEVPTPHGRLIDAYEMLSDESEAFMSAQLKVKDEATRLANEVVRTKIQMLVIDTPTVIEAEADNGKE